MMTTVPQILYVMECDGTQDGVECPYAVSGHDEHDVMERAKIDGIVKEDGSFICNANDHDGDEVFELLKQVEDGEQHG